MDKKPGNQGEAGSITLIAIIVMVAFGILLAGLLPFITHTGISAAYSVRSLQAHYAAEAGAKRAIVGLAQGSGSWGWLGNEVNLTDSTGTDIQYRVSITPPDGLTLTSAPATGTYKVTSVGMYGRSTKTVTVQVTIATGNLSAINSTFAIGGSITTNPANSSYTFSSNGEVVYAKSIEGNVKFGGNLYTNNENKYLNQDKNLQVAKIDIDYALSLATKTFQKPVKSDQELVLTGGTVYSCSGDLNLDETVNCTIKGPTSDGDKDYSNDFALVVVKGDLNITTTACLHMKNNVLFLVGGDVMINSNSTDFADSIFYCNGDIVIKNITQNATVQMIAGGNLVLENNFYNSNPNEHTGLTECLKTISQTAGVTISNWSDGN
jgi:hypothetical protein